MSAGDLLTAAYYGNIQKVLKLLDVDKINVNTIVDGSMAVGVSESFGFALAAVAAGWHEGKELVTLLLDRGADVNLTGDDYGSALTVAAGCGNKEIVSLLLDRGADVNLTGGDYGGALGAAACGGHLELVTLLLDRGADVNLTGDDYGSALTVAAGCGNKEIVSLMLDRGADVNLTGGDHGSALSAAAARYQGGREIVTLLLDRGADVNSTGGKYGCALVAAACVGHQEIVSLLLDRGADVKLTGGDHGSALSAAAARYQGGREIVSLLLDRGADVNSTGGQYGCALSAAAFQGYQEVVSLLLDRGADVNLTGGDYGSALGAAAFGLSAYTGDFNWDIVSLLLDRGADVNSTGGKYGCALGVAAYGGSREIVSLLLDRGVDINNTGGEYGCALGAAAYAGSREIILLLLDRGAEVNRTGGDYGSVLGAASCAKHYGIVSLLLSRGADAKSIGGNYGSVLGAAVYGGSRDIVSLLLDRGADVNSTGGDYGCALGAAAFQGHQEIVSLLLDRGADANTTGGVYGSALAAASHNGHRDIVSMLQQYPSTGAKAKSTGGHSGTSLEGPAATAEPSDTQTSPCAKLLLGPGADINLVDCKYGSLLGKAVYEGNTKLVSLLLASGADAFHVGGEYETVTGEYPTALDAARAGKANDDIVTLLSRFMNNPVHKRDDTPWPPFPVPFRSSIVPMHITRDTPLTSTHGFLGTLLNSLNQAHTCGGNLTPAQADLPCKAVDEELLRTALVALVEIHQEAAERLQVWIRNDIRYIINQEYDLGLAYAAARIAWKGFNDPDFNVAAHRAQWLAKARQIDEARENSIYMDQNGQGLIKSPYRIMPRRIWDLKSNRVVEFRMLHSDVLAREYLSSGVVIDLDHAEAPCPTFWAISHSWTDDMSPAKTSINQNQWLAPLPEGIDLERDVRKEILNTGADYVWLDVLCLRQHGHPKDDEWKLDVPTIGNIYHTAVGIARYFNGLGQAFSANGWDDPRHWLRRAWTLQETKSESTTYNAGISQKTSGYAHNIMNTKSVVGGHVITLRQALHPIVKLAGQVDSPNGCSVYKLVKQMTNRYATQPTDKVAGLFYLLRTAQLPTYGAGISDRDAWAQGFYVLPFERKIEILFDFPYGGDDHPNHGRQWFPAWSQLMQWPDRDPAFSHKVAVWSPNQAHLLLGQAQKPEHIVVSDIWAISDVRLCQTNERHPYEIDIIIGNKIFAFYYPYVPQKPIEVSTSGQYTLVTTYPDNSNNWVVCESLGKRHENYTTSEGIKTAEIESLRKLGVLRTDSCSEFVLGRGKMDSTLKKINALFV